MMRSLAVADGVYSRRDGKRACVAMTPLIRIVAEVYLQILPTEQFDLFELFDLYNTDIYAEKQ